MIALEVRVFANRTGQAVTRLLVAEMMSEFDGREGMVLQTAARIATYSTVCRLAGAPTASRRAGRPGVGMTYAAITDADLAAMVPWTTGKDMDGDTVHTTPDGFQVTRTGRTLYITTLADTEARALTGGRYQLRYTTTLTGCRRIIVAARAGEYRHG